MKTFICILLILFSEITVAETGKLKGEVTDGSSAIPFVNIIILDTNFGTATKLDGSYEIKGIPAGNYEVRYSVIGFDSEMFDVEIEANETTELNVELTSKAIELQSIEVTDFQVQDQRDTRTSLIDLNPRDAKTLPPMAMKEESGSRQCRIRTARGIQRPEMC